MESRTSSKPSIIAFILSLSILFITIVSIVIAEYSSVVDEHIQQIKTKLTHSTTQLISSSLGSPMREDNNWNINVLIVWYGGDWHDGAYLTDSMIVASFNPEKQVVSMISIPRDFVVNNNWLVVKINSIFPRSYYKTQSLTSATQSLAEKMTEITGLPIPYYVLVDFDGFLSFIDTIWWVDVDIPYAIYDRAYPGPNWSYTIFSIDAWPQHLDAATALKYARSRHSSSDFSRSQRQQLIIEAVLKKLLSDWFSVERIQNIYNTYITYIKTNISIDEMIWLIKYGTRPPRLVNFGYTYECSNTIWQRMKPACLLYPVNQEEYNGMAGMLPRGAYLGRLSYYKETQEFAQFVTSHPGAFKESYLLKIYNAAHPSIIKPFPYRNSAANNLAIKLKRYWFEVDTVEDNPNTLSGTLAVIHGTGSYTDTLQALWEFITIDEVKMGRIPTGTGEVDYIDLYLGDSFFEEFAQKPFNTYLDRIDYAK